jgi:uncharacterized membrane protein YbaN (DUF454 family)
MNTNLPAPKHNKSQLAWFWSGIGFLILGIIGLLIPVIPQVPFFLASLLCFARASKKLSAFLKHFKLYHKAKQKLKGTKFDDLFE